MTASDTVYEETIDAVSDFRDWYRSRDLDVPDAEIVMHPKTFSDLMSDERSISLTSCMRQERNFFGCVVETDCDVIGIVVRDRTEKR